MTIIAYKDGILAADTAIWVDPIKVADSIKIGRREDGWLIAGAGCMAVVESARSAFVEGASVDDLKPIMNDEEATVIIITPDHEVVSFVGDLTYKVKMEMESIGIAREFAIGVMRAGRTAEQAIALSIVNCMGCGGDITSLRHDREGVVTRSLAEVLAEIG